jgi:flagellin
MSLVVRTNVSALYAQNALKTNARSTATAMERLSTGVRVNGTKDDAAGLAIGQNMTSRIRGLDQAVRNINDGINLVQTAEGGLNSVSTMLQRMRELAVQAANGTYSDVQRRYLNQECQQLKTAIGQLVDTTMWNDQKLLDGTFSKPIQMGSDVGAKMDITIPSASLIASTTNSITTVPATKAGGVVGSTALASGDLTINFTPIGGAAASAKDVAAAINLQTGTTGVTATARATLSTPATQRCCGCGISGSVVIGQSGIGWARMTQVTSDLSVI